MLDLITVPELDGKEFYVPAYQRGYRWTKTEITALLNDMAEFDASNGNWYCLQPIVVKKLADNRYELVDGQQRLTTLYIILLLISEWLSNSKRHIDKPGYTIEYETREDSRSFLEELSEPDETKLNKTQSNPDYHYLYNAMLIIYDYFTKVDETDALRNRIIKSTKFIWYEIENENPISLFKKLNLGKVPLSSSELIKATLLNRRYFKVSNSEKLSPDAREHEVEIQRAMRSNEWDSIEYALNEPEFWGFLTNVPLNESPCMELLFNAIASEIIEESSFDINSKDRNFSFLVIWEYLKQSQDAADKAYELWDRVKLKFSRLKEWYCNDKLYHLIGFLVACKEDGQNRPLSISELEAKLLSKNAKKSEVEADLIKEIRKIIDVSSREVLFDLLDSVDYETKKARVSNILLLFNVVTILSPLYGGEKRNKCDMRFPFYIYKDKKMKWDIEHIEAKQQSENKGEEADNSLGNLALLDCKTNREYQDANFSIKRKHIRDKENEGRFIPICTLNVFNKTYTPFSTESDVPVDFKVWDDDTDKVCYVEEIKTKLGAFLFGTEVDSDGK